MASQLRRFTVAALAAGAVGSFLLVPGQALAAGSAAPGPSAPKLVSPADDNNESAPLKDVVLKWDPVSGASSYQVQVSPNSNFTNNTVTLPNNGATDATTYELPISLPHSAYFWRVRSVEGSQQGSWSAPFEFLREWDSSTTPSGSFTMLTDPSVATDATGMGNPLFSWTPVPDASLYEVRLSTQPNFPTGSDTFNCLTAATSLFPYQLESSKENGTTGSCFDETQLTNGKSYYWLVRPYDDSTAATLSADDTNDPNFECSQVQPECDAVTQSGRFTFQAPAAGAAVTGNATGLTTSYRTTTGGTVACTSTDACPTTPTLSWNPVLGANYYQVAIYLDPDMTNVYRVYDTAYTSLTPRDLFYDDQDYRAFYWTVTPGTCTNSSSDLTCASGSSSSSTSSNSDCPANSSGTGAPAVTAVAATPQGQEGSASAPGDSTVSVSLTGTGFTSDSCVTASDGTIVGSPTANGSTITFNYRTPTVEAGEQVTFTVTAPGSGGGTSAASPALTIDPASKINLMGNLTSSVATFDIRTGSVELQSPADQAQANAEPTFSWSDYLTSGGADAAEARNYDLQISTDPDFNSTTIDNTDIDLTQWTSPTAMDSGTYYWRVAPIDQSGNLLAWSATRTVQVDGTSPTITVKSARRAPVDGPLTVTSSEPLSGVVTGRDSRSIELEPTVGGQTLQGRLTSVSKTSYSLQPTHRLVTGATYQVVLNGLRDAAGNYATLATPTVRTTPTADDRSPAWRFAGRWTQHTSSLAMLRTYRAGRPGATASVQFVGRHVTLYGCKAPQFGKETIKVDGHTKASVSLRHGFNECGLRLWSGRVSSASAHQLTVRVSQGTGDVDDLHVS